MTYKGILIRSQSGGDVHCIATGSGTFQEAWEGAREAHMYFVRKGLAGQYLPAVWPDTFGPHHSSEGGA